MTAIPWQRIEGKYEILEKLGEGGMGAVYKVRHRLLDEIRVVKMMRPQLVENEDLKTRFFREARVAIQLRHPHIAQLYDFTVDEDGVAYIVMEFIPGMTVESVLRNAGPLPLGMALEIAQQALKALGYLHGRGFIHRDISPDNVMLTEGPDGEPMAKLIDLGIAKTLGAAAGGGGYLTQTGTFLGKVRYSPPEQFGSEGAAAVDARGDLYSFGVVLYELLTGRYPIRGRDPQSLIAGHLFWPPLDFAESDEAGRVPAGLREVVLKALAKNADERFPTAQEMSRALAAFRAPGDVTDGELQRLFSQATASGTARVLPRPGSTQDRLDLQFGMRTTPSPSRIVEVTEAFLSAPQEVVDAALEAAEAEERRREVAAVAARVEEKLAKGDFRGAELMLFEAEVDYGTQKVFASLHERLAGERRRNLEAKALDRRRAEQIAAAIAEIEERLDRGDVDRASEILDETASTFGDDTVSGELRARLSDLRRQAREAEVNALAEAAGERFDLGDFEGALEAAGQLERIAPGHAVARSLRKKVAAERRRREEEARKAAREAEIGRLLASARERLDGGDLEGALEDLGRIRDLDPERAEARELQERIEAGQSRRREEARRAAERAAAVAAIEARLAAEDLDGAEARLTEAASVYPEEERLQALRDRLERQREQQRRAAREAEIARLLASARQRFAKGVLDGALAALDKVESLDPGRAEARSLRQEIEAAQQRREEEARRESELVEALAAIDALLEAADLEGAAARVSTATAALGEDRLLRQRGQRIDELRRRKLEERADGLLAEARRLAAGKELDPALEALREAARLRPDHAATRALIEEVETARRQREEEARRERELAAAVAEIDAALETGRAEEAARLLPAAVAAFGGAEVLRARWERLEALRRKAGVAALLAKAEALLRSGDTARATRTLRQALDLDPGNRAAEDLMRKARDRE